MAEYISREAVQQVLYGIANGLSVGEAEALKTKDIKALYKIKGAKEILDSVDNDLCFVPSADVQPVKRGKWLYSDEYITTAYGTIHFSKCSVCNTAIAEIDNYDNDFCPNCGADMRGDTNDKT